MVTIFLLPDPDRIRKNTKMLYNNKFYENYLNDANIIILLIIFTSKKHVF